MKIISRPRINRVGYLLPSFGKSRFDDPAVDDDYRRYPDVIG